MPETFLAEWRPQYGASVNKQERTFDISFGDGYSQRSSIGITPVLRVWTVTFHFTHDIINDIDSFLSKHKGISYFNWVDIQGVTGKYICSEWAISYPHFNYGTLNGIFEEVVDNG